MICILSPFFFNVIAYLSYFELYVALYEKILFAAPGLEFVWRDMQMKPQEIKWAVPYLRGKKKLGPNTFCQVLRKLVTFLIELLLIFVIGFLYTFPFSPLMMIHGEANE